MSDNSSPTPPSGGNARLIGAVVLAGAVAAGAMMLLRPGATPEAPKTPEKTAAPAPAPAPVPPAPKVFSETIGDLELTTAMGPLSIKGLKTVNASLPKAAIEAMLKGDTSQFAKLDAEAITADSMSWSQSVGQNVTNSTYEGISAKGIKAGVIGSVTVLSGTSKGLAADKSVKSEATIGEISLASFDVPLLMRWFNDADPEGKAAFAPLHGAYSIKSMKVLIDKAQVDFGPMLVSKSLLRPARRPVNAILADFRKMTEASQAEARQKAEDLKGEISKIENGKGDAPKGESNPFANAGKDGAAKATPPAAPAPEEPKKAVAKPDDNVIYTGVIDLMSSFELGEGSVDGIRIATTDPKADENVTADIRKLSFAGGAKARFGFEGLGVKATDGTFNLGKVEMGGDALSLFMLAGEKALRARADAPKPGDEELRALIKSKVSTRPLPDVTFVMEALNGDFPAEKTKPEAGRVTFDMKRAMFMVGNFVSLSPTKIDYVVDSLNVPMPKDSREAAVIALRAMGIERLGVSARLAAAWAEVGEKLTLQELSVDVSQLARLAITGEMGAVPRTFFEDPQRNWPSAMGATINSLIIDIDNKGGLAKLVDVVAKEQKKTGEQLRNEFANIAPLVITGMLSGHPDGGKLSQAVSNFIRNLNALHLKVTAAGPNGIVLTDLAMAGQNPAEFAQKLRFEVEGK